MKKPIFVIFGATGNLTKRKLIPAFYRLYLKGKLNYPIVCVARRDLTKEQFIKHLEARKFIPKADKNKLESFFNKVSYYSLNFVQEDMSGLKKYLNTVDKKYNCKGNRIFYLAIPPTLFKPTLKNVKEDGLLKGLGYKRLVYEKPFGHDLDSARELNNYIKKIFKEKDIYRIDHYLGKELVQNLLMLRFTNSLFEQIWNNKFIDHVEITVAEDIGIEERAAYYDKTGAIIDIVQNHVMQILALAAMEKPKNLKPETIMAEKAKVIKALEKVRAKDIVIGQYQAGIIGKKKVIGYRKEKDIPRDSKVETYTAMKVFINNKRWKGVPFYIRTGKRLAVRNAAIHLVLKDVDCKLFHGGDCQFHPNIITERIQPNEGVEVQFNVKLPGQGMKHEPVIMNFCHQCKYAHNTAEAYEFLLNEIIVGDQTLFTGWDFVEASWKFTDDAVKKARRKKLIPYKAGSMGPMEAEKLVKWIEVRL